MSLVGLSGSCRYIRGSEDIDIMHDKIDIQISCSIPTPTGDSCYNSSLHLPYLALIYKATRPVLAARLSSSTPHTPSSPVNRLGGRGGPGYIQGSTSRHSAPRDDNLFPRN